MSEVKCLAWTNHYIYELVFNCCEADVYTDDWQSVEHQRGQKMPVA